MKVSSLERKLVASLARLYNIRIKNCDSRGNFFDLVFFPSFFFRSAFFLFLRLATITGCRVESWFIPFISAPLERRNMYYTVLSPQSTICLRSVNSRSFQLLRWMFSACNAPSSRKTLDFLISLLRAWYISGCSVYCNFVLAFSPTRSPATDYLLFAFSSREIHFDQTEVCSALKSSARPFPVVFL